MALWCELAGAQLTCCHLKFLYRAWDSSSKEEKLRQGPVRAASPGGALLPGELGEGCDLGELLQLALSASSSAAGDTSDSMYASM